jgi:putative MATE family efflux protein
MTAPARKPAKFLTGSILRHVLVMTATGAIGLVAIFLAELLDVGFLSKLGDTQVLAAVGYAGPLVFLTVSISIGLSIATVANVAPAIGAGDRAMARRLSASVHVLAALASAVLSLALLPFLPSLLAAMGAQGRTAELALRYLWIVVPSLPPLALAMVSSAVLRSVGDAQRAMHVTLGAAVVIVILDPILIFWAGLGLEGAALATVASRLAIMFVGLHAVWRLHGLIERPSLANIRADLAPVLAIALPAVATNAATPVASAIVTAAFAPFGDSAVAGWAVISRVQPVAFGFVFAMSGTVGPIIGQNLGAGQHARMREAYVVSLQVVVGYTLAAWLVLALASGWLVRMFELTGDGAALVGMYCLSLAPIFGFQGALFVANAVFNTLQRPRLATAINWARALLGTLPFTMVGSAVMGAPGVLIGNLVGGVVFGSIAVWMGFRLLDRVAESRPPGARRPTGDAPPLAGGHPPGAVKDVR